MANIDLVLMSSIHTVFFLCLLFPGPIGNAFFAIQAQIRVGVEAHQLERWRTRILKSGRQPFLELGFFRHGDQDNRLKGRVKGFFDNYIENILHFGAVRRTTNQTDPIHQVGCHLLPVTLDT